MSSSCLRWRAASGMVAAAVLLAIGCASPAAPTGTIPSTSASLDPAPASAPVVLTVRVLQRSVETPLPGATVVLGAEVANANADGLCTFSLHAGNMADVEVSAPGYLPLAASGVLNNDQRWTFYLEADGR